MRAAVLAGFVFASRASAQMHGYVEPCAVPFVQDSKTTCEECPFNHSDPKACARTLGERGYTFECRTKGHSVPAEVWCRPREGEDALPRPLLLTAVVGAVVLFTAGFLWWKRKPAA